MALNRHFIGRAVQRKTDKAIIKRAMLPIRMNCVAFFLFMRVDALVICRRAFVIYIVACIVTHENMN